MKKSKDVINHPSHYADSKIEPIEVIEDWKLGFYDGNVIKYLKRQGKKESQIICIKKCVWYLLRYLWILTGDEKYKNMKV